MEVDHYSRRATGFAICPKRHDSLSARTFVGNIIARINASPKDLIFDKDRISWCDAVKRWCQRNRIRPWFGAVGQHGSIAVVERLIRIMKDEATCRIVVPQRQAGFRREPDAFITWYNEHRPHSAIDGKTPNEGYFRLRPANRRPRIEPRERWPRTSPCAKPLTLIAGQPGDRFTLQVDFCDARRHLPVVSLKRAA